jgi:hypothetical protein
MIPKGSTSAGMTEKNALFDPFSSSNYAFFPPFLGVSMLRNIQYLHLFTEVQNFMDIFDQK